MVIKYKLKDTGLDKINGTELYTKVSSGNWIDFNVFSNNFEFTGNQTNNVAPRNDSDDNSFMTFKNNEPTSVLPPRFTLRGLILASDKTTIENLIKLKYSKGVKRLAGGIGTISAMPGVETDTDGSYDYVSVLVKNITVSEVISKDEDYADMSIQLEQLR